MSSFEHHDRPTHQFAPYPWTIGAVDWQASESPQKGIDSVLPTICELDFRWRTLVCDSDNAARPVRLTPHMNTQWITGMALVTLAGVMQGAFAFPMKFTRKWAWENIWLASSLFGL